ncbi:hypothetical protein JW826_01785 [Candidatus Woesearchaeota archaeon]|nr:hypothetical protein [Candidatus Woesearchaeota archaeon]
MLLKEEPELREIRRFLEEQRIFTLRQPFPTGYCSASAELVYRILNLPMVAGKVMTCDPKQIAYNWTHTCNLGLAQTSLDPDRNDPEGNIEVYVDLTKDQFSNGKRTYQPVSLEVTTRSTFQRYSPRDEQAFFAIMRGRTEGSRKEYENFQRKMDALEQTYKTRKCQSPSPATSDPFS